MIQIKTNRRRFNTHEILNENGIYIEDPIYTKEIARDYIKDKIEDDNRRLIIETYDYYNTNTYIFDADDSYEDMMNTICEKLISEEDFTERVNDYIENEGYDEEEAMSAVTEDLCNGDGITWIRWSDKEEVEELLKDNRLDIWEVA